MARAVDGEVPAGHTSMKAHDYVEGGVPHRTTDSFATAETVQSCIMYLNQSLEIFGFPILTTPSGDEAVSLAQACNCIYALLDQRQTDTRQLDASFEQQQRLLSDSRRLEKKVERCEAQVAAKEAELQMQIGKEHKAAQGFRAQVAKLQAERDEFQKLALGSQQVRTQQAYELRKKEKEYARLQEKLSSTLTERKERSRASIDIVNLLQKEGRTRATWGGKKADGDFYKMLVDAHEAKKQQLLDENAEVKATLRSLQQEIKSLVRDYDEASSLDTPPEASASTSSSRLPGTESDVYDLPYSMAKEQIEADLYEGLALLREVVDRATRGEQQRLAQSELPGPADERGEGDEASRALEEERQALRKLAARLDQEQQQLDAERRSFAEEQMSFSTTLRLWAPTLAPNTALSQMLSPKLLRRLETSPTQSLERRLSAE